MIYRLNSETPNIYFFSIEVLLLPSLTYQQQNRLYEERPQFINADVKSYFLDLHPFLPQVIYLDVKKEFKQVLLTIELP